MSSRPYWKGCAAPAEWPQGCAGLGLQSPGTNHPVHGCVPPAGTSPEPPDTGATTASSARSSSNVGVTPQVTGCRGSIPLILRQCDGVTAG